MTDLNSITIIGRAVRVPELKDGGSWKKLSLSIANNRSTKQSSGWVDTVSYFDVIEWGDKAERHSGKITKGTKVLVVGRLQQERWEKDGHTFSRVTICADSIEIINPSKNSAQAHEPSDSYYQDQPDEYSGGYGEAEVNF